MKECYIITILCFINCSLAALKKGLWVQNKFFGSWWKTRMSLRWDRYSASKQKSTGRLITTSRPSLIWRTDGGAHRKLKCNKPCMKKFCSENDLKQSAVKKPHTSSQRFDIIQTKWCQNEWTNVHYSVFIEINSFEPISFVISSLNEFKASTTGWNGPFTTLKHCYMCLDIGSIRVNMNNTRWVLRLSSTALKGVFLVLVINSN